jgi:zinc protease
LAPVREVLANGAVVIAKQSQTTPAVTIGSAFRAGSLYDPPELPGVAHFLARVIDRGTDCRNAEAIADDLDWRGVSLNVAVGRHLMTIWCTSLVEDFDAMIDLVGEIARRPTLPETEISTRRGEIATAIRQDDDNTAVVAMDTLSARLYPDAHPYGQRLRGTLEIVERIDRGVLQAFHRARFAPASLSLVVVGDVSPRQAIDAASRAFGDWTAPAPPTTEVPAVLTPSTRQRLIVPMMNKVQADIAYGFVGIKRRDPAYHAFSVMNNVLGQYALGGRLGDSIRERQGMAYYVFSAFEAGVGAGPFVVRAGVDPRNVNRALASIDEEIGRMAEHGISERELADSQQYMVGSLPCTLETNAGIAAFLQAAEQFQLGLDYDQRLPGLIRAVTRDEVNAVARAYLSPDRATLSVAGPYGEARARDSSAPGMAASQ